MATDIRTRHLGTRRFPPCKPANTETSLVCSVFPRSPRGLWQVLTVPACVCAEGPYCFWQARWGPCPGSVLMSWRERRPPRRGPASHRAKPGHGQIRQAQQPRAENTCTMNQTGLPAGLGRDGSLPRLLRQQKTVWLQIFITAPTRWPEARLGL